MAPSQRPESRCSSKAIRNSLGSGIRFPLFSTYKGFFAVTFSDITERKLVDQEIRRHSATVEGINKVLSTALVCKTEEELGGVCLEVAEKLTQSEFGFIGEINESGLQDIAISNPGREARKIIDRAGRRESPGSFKIHGVYGRIISDGKGLFTNNACQPRRSRWIAGWASSLESFLGVPLIHEGKTIGTIAMGNRPGGYSTAELQALEALAPAIVEAFMRYRAELELRKAHDELDQKVRGTGGTGQSQQHVANDFRVQPDPCTRDGGGGADKNGDLPHHCRERTLSHGMGGLCRR